MTIENLPSDLERFLKSRDGAKDLAVELPKRYSPLAIAKASVQQQVWEAIGLYYFNDAAKRRCFEALGIFYSLYRHMLKAQTELHIQVHKGMPLLWIAECWGAEGFSVLRKRYLMLALCEDAVRGSGNIIADESGVYFRLVWRLGMNDEILRRYAEEAYAQKTRNPQLALYPEWILQQLDQNWMTEFPSPHEANLYLASPDYTANLVDQLGDSQGNSLELLAEYIMLCMPGCRTSRRQRSPSTDYDLICSMEGYDIDYRSELGRYFVCECKDWTTAADFASFAKFCRVLDSVKAKFGILFSKNGLTGDANTRAATREQLKVYQDRGMVIVVVDEKDLRSVAAGGNFVNMLRRKYEKVRLDLSENR